MIVRTFFATVLLAFALLGGAPAPTKAAAAGPSNASPSPGGRALVISDSAATCNCTGGEATLSVCHVSSVNVNVGGDVVNVQTGQSSSSCASTTVPPRRCLYFRYLVQCDYRGFWGGWDCHLVSTNARCRDTSSDEC